MTIFRIENSTTLEPIVDLALIDTGYGITLVATDRQTEIENNVLSITPNGTLERHRIEIESVFKLDEDKKIIGAFEQCSPTIVKLKADKERHNMNNTIAIMGCKDGAAFESPSIVVHVGLLKSIVDAFEEAGRTAIKLSVAQTGDTCDTDVLILQTADSKFYGIGLAERDDHYIFEETAKEELDSYRTADLEKIMKTIVENENNGNKDCV